jgi:hypothetical protein
MSDSVDRLEMVFNVSWPTFVILLPLALLFGFPLLSLAFVVVIAIGCLMLVSSLLTHLFSWLIYRDDPEYQELRARGVHPYWDLIPWPINSNSEIENTVQEEVPADGLATKICPSCQASVKEPVPGCFYTGVRCWQCNKVMRACPGCFNLVGEPVIGGFESPQGVSCPFCGLVMRPVGR